MTTPMHEAGGRLFVDVTRGLASPSSRAGLLQVLGRSDPLIGDALQTILDRGDFIRPLQDEGRGAPAAANAPAPIETDPAIVTSLIERNRASIAQLKRDIDTKSGPALLDFILADMPELKRILFDPQSHQVIMAGMEAFWWLNEKLEAWLGEKNAADTLTQSVPHNVTSEMGLALLDVADVIRPHPQVVDFLQHVDDDDFLSELPKLEGGREAHDAILASGYAGLMSSDEKPGAASEETKRKFREALDRKNKASKQREGESHLDGTSGANNTHGPVDHKREFRRKSG